MHARIATALVTLGLLWPQALAANPLKSLYSTIELKSCRIVRRHQDGNQWVCPGLDGYPIYYAEGDLRSYVSVGSRSAKSHAASQTLRPFNSIFKGQSARTTLEWRFYRRDGRVVPFATILRYFTSLDGKKGEVLVVNRVAGPEVCHVAYVDALANPDAIALARRAADDMARKFKCGSEPMVLGRTGQSPM